MPFLDVKNRAESSLASDINNSVNELTVDSGDGVKYPASNFRITIEDEILHCSSRTNDVLTVTRGAESTTPAAHVAGKRVELRITAEIINELQTANEAVNASYADVTGSRAMDTIYRNTSGKTMIVLVTVRLQPSSGSNPHDESVIAKVGSGTPPGDDLGRVGLNATSTGSTISHSILTMIVPNNYYYRALEALGTNGEANIVKWVEITS